MHAHLLISQNSKIEPEIEKLSAKLGAVTLEFPLKKIDDARNLNNLIRLSFEKPTLIISRDIHEATEETLNAFLKNLEEPQDNVYFVLTAPSIKKVLPTITSRCQIILVSGSPDESKNSEETQKFLALNEGEKLHYIEKIKDRGQALELVENTVNFLHSKLHSGTVKYSVAADNLEIALKTHSGLKANGNVNLQLVNFVINLKNG